MITGRGARGARHQLRPGAREVRPIGVELLVGAPWPPDELDPLVCDLV